MNWLRLLAWFFVILGGVLLIGTQIPVCYDIDYLAPCLLVPRSDAWAWGVGSATSFLIGIQLYLLDGRE